MPVFLGYFVAVLAGCLTVRFYDKGKRTFLNNPGPWTNIKGPKVAKEIIQSMVRDNLWFAAVLRVS